MKYKFAIEKLNYEDYASGRVLYNQHGATSFPVRLASEIFQHCASILTNQGLAKPYIVYDPCCGGAHLLTTLGFLHGNFISKIYASDIDSKVIKLAKRNLALLTIEGIDKRIEQIDKLITSFNKSSHADALKSAKKFKSILDKREFSIQTHLFNADITEDNIIKKVSNVNIVITDLPYGDLAHWNHMQKDENAIARFLDNILPILAVNSVVATISMKKIKIKHDKYIRVKRFNIGKRQIVILQPIKKG